MIGSDLAGADPESRVTSRGGGATSEDIAAVRAVMEADMYRQVPEQSGGGCSGT